MENKRSLDEFRSSYGCSDEEEEEEDVSDNEEWLSSRPYACNFGSPPAISSVFPPSKKQRIDDSLSKPTQQTVSPAKKPSLQPDYCFGHSRTIIHVDIDCFYAQVEMIRNPELRNVPLGIQQKHIVVTCNYVARKRGIKKLSYVSDAKKNCPDLVLVNGEDLTVYREFSGRVHSLLTREFTPLVERLGMDENFLDVTELVTSRLQSTSLEDRDFSGVIYNRNPDANEAKFVSPCPCGCHERLKVGSVIAAEVRQAILYETGLTCCAGISHNKLLAKLVGGWKKPNMQTTLLPEDAESFLSGLQAKDIPGIGHSMAKTLQMINVFSVTDLLSCPIQVLEKEFGNLQAVLMTKLCHGIDDSKVIPSGEYKSISDEDSFQKCSTLEDARKRLINLIEGLLPRVSSDAGVPDTVRVTVRRRADSSYRRESRQCRLPHTISFANKNKARDALLTACLHLFNKVIDIKKPFHLTLLGVTLSNFHKPSTTQSKDISNFFQKSSSKMKVSTSFDDSIRTKHHSSDVNKFTASVSESIKAENTDHVTNRRDLFDPEDQEPQGPQVNESATGLSKPVACPKGIDPLVFAELPSEMQRELQEHWQQQYTKPMSNNTFDTGKKTPKTKINSGIQRYFGRNASKQGFGNVLK